MRPSERADPAPASAPGRPRRRAAPLPVLLLLAFALAAQLAWHAMQPSGGPLRPTGPELPGPDRPALVGGRPPAGGGPAGAEAPPTLPAPLPAPPPPMPLAGLQLASLGEPLALSKLLMLYLQGIDEQAGRSLAWRALDYGRLAGWLERALALDPRSQYPLLAASQVYSAVNDAARCRLMLDLVYREFARDPARRWPWLAHAALLARHRLHDLPLARRYAAAIRTQAGGAPAWARELEVFILEDMNELDSARKLIGAMLASGQIADPNEARFLARRLDALQQRGAAPAVDRPAAGLVR